MNITHVITNISRKGGGTSTYLRDLLNALPHEISNTLLSYYSEDALLLNPKILVKHLPTGKKGFGINSKDFKKVCDTFTTQIFHGNGLWDFPPHAMAKYARKNEIPYIISPHGMLEPWSLTQSKYKKQVALKLYQRKDLKLASCIHATAVSEANNIRALGYQNPIAVIPNGINLEEFQDYIKKTCKKRKVLFLSRIHPKKGIELLVQAWKELEIKTTKDWEVEIVGNGNQQYIHSLEILINSLGLEKVIKISDPVFGKAKLEAYRSANLFVLPTYSENFGIVIAEALALNIPVITTKGTPWEELNTYNCGQWIDIGKEPLKEALKVMLSKPQHVLDEMGSNGRKLVESKYSMTAVAQQMLQLYKWIVLKEDQPNFVYLD